ncbi:MAG: helix-turn-helix transcriptional regulator [Gemmobacter sp.]
MSETVVISRDEYDRLVEAAEDLADLQAYDRAVAEGGEGLPHAFMVRLIEGENAVRVFREWRGLTQAETARMAGVHRVQLHDIETGKKRGSVDTLKAIAAALSVPLDDIA